MDSPEKRKAAIVGDVEELVEEGHFSLEEILDDINDTLVHLVS